MRVAFSPDGQHLASTSGDYTGRLWSVGTGELREILTGHSSSMTAVAYSPNGQLLASASEDETIRLWDSRTEKFREALQSHSCWVSAVIFSPHGELFASASWDGTVKLWISEGGALRHHHQGPFRSGLRGGLFKEQWVALGTEKMLWLPSDYRAICWAVHDNIIVLGHASGRISLLKLGLAQCAIY